MKVKMSVEHSALVGCLYHPLKFREHCGSGGGKTGRSRGRVQGLTEPSFSLPIYKSGLPVARM